MGRTQTCGDCEGAGRTRDYDEDRGHEIAVRCEACLGVGDIRDCDRCLEPSPIPELELGSGRCVSCRIELETMAVEDDLANLRRSA